MRPLATALLAALFTVTSCAQPRPYDLEPDASLSFDFQTTFPHKFWISSWNRDHSYPAGFRYKLLSARREPAGPIELVVILEQPGGFKTEMKRYDVEREAFDRVAQTFVDGLAVSHAVDFEVVDLSWVLDPREFEEAAQAAGWYEWEP